MNQKKMNLRRELSCGSDGLNHCNRKNRTCFAPQGAQLAQLPSRSQPFPAVPSLSQPFPAVPSSSILRSGSPDHNTSSSRPIINCWKTSSCGLFHSRDCRATSNMDVASCRIVDFACQNSRHLISFFCRSVNVCPCVSQSCPPRSEGLSTVIARSVPVSSQALTLLRVLLPAYLILSSPRKTPRLRRPSSLQKVPGPGHEGIGSPGWLHQGCGANGS